MIESFSRTIREDDAPEHHWLAEVSAFGLGTNGIAVQLPDWARNNMSLLPAPQARELAAALVEAADWYEAHSARR